MNTLTPDPAMPQKSHWPDYFGRSAPTQGGTILDIGQFVGHVHWEVNHGARTRLFRSLSVECS